MCGLAGIISFDASEPSGDRLTRMTRAIAHRGPDGEGFFVDGPVGLGHRRLAVIDLTDAARQPMSTDNGRFTIAYNGEVYNFRELRAELESLGRRFGSRTDSEVVLQAYAQWGVDCLERFNGMFAFAIWDKLGGELFLARDRYGIKPLYYSFTSRRFLFGSEQKAVLAHGDVRRQIDPEALVEYFTFQNFFTDRTLMRGVKMFPAGCWAKVSPDRNQGRLDLVRYWDFDFREPDRPADMRQYVRRGRRLFAQAVRRQLVSDVDVGAYLSGGLDSGSITSVAARELPGMRTFTVGFDLSSASGMELAFDERAAAGEMARAFDTEHYETVLKAGDMERVFARLARHIEEPRVGQSYPNYCAAELAAGHVKVVLDGTGGDELLAGYPWRYRCAEAGGGFEDYIDRCCRYWRRLMDGDEMRRVFAPIAGEIREVSTRDIFRGVFRAGAEELTGPEDYVNHSLQFEARTFLHGLLVVSDKLSMAHGLEARVPFLDNDFVDFAMRVPVAMKLGDSGRRSQGRSSGPARDGKLLLREMMSPAVPDSVVKASKQGFSAPDASWFRGPSIEYVKTQLYDRRARIYDYMDPSAVGELVGEHLSGKRNRRLLIWSLLSFGHWLDEFLPAHSA